jgi:pyrroline-5-carboxylate reductase
VRAVEAIDDAALACDVLVLAVKPQQLRAAVAPIAGRLDRQLVVSIAAGLRLADIGRWLGGHGKLVRCMPTPALIGAGITGLFADASVDAAGRAAAEGAGGGRLHRVGADEAQIDGVTAISGSGPAYVFHFIECLQASGEALGFDADTARKLAIDTVLGAARLAAGSAESPAVLRERVTSKGGTTAAALASMAADGFPDRDPRGGGSRSPRARARRRAGPRLIQEASCSEAFSSPSSKPSAAFVRRAAGTLHHAVAAGFVPQPHRPVRRGHHRLAGAAPAAFHSRPGGWIWPACCRRGWCRFWWCLPCSACWAGSVRQTRSACWP